MHLFSAILFAFSANMDNIPLGIAYGIRGIKINPLKNLLIAFITSTGTLISMSLGEVITLFISEAIAAIIGSSLLMAIGLWFIFRFFSKRRKGLAQEQGVPHTEWAQTEAETEAEAEAQAAVSQVATSITTRQSMGLALVLMVNNMGFGISANIAGLPILLTSVCTFLCSMFLLLAGVTIGLRLASDRLGIYSELISGILITILGFYEFFV